MTLKELYDHISEATKENPLLWDMKVVRGGDGKDVEYLNVYPHKYFDFAGRIIRVEEELEIG